MSDNLLTNQDKQEFVARALGSKFNNRGELFKPAAVFYSNKLDNHGLQKIYNSLCSWLGIPRSTLRVRFRSENVEQSVSDVLYLQPSLSKHPEICAAIISRKLAIELLTRKSKRLDLKVSPDLVDIFTLEYGLGIVMLNGLGQDRLPLNMLGELGQLHLARSGYLPGRVYAKRLVDYSHRFGLDITDWGGYLTPKGRKLLPRVLRHPARKAAKRPVEVINMDKQQTLARINIAVLSVLGIFVIGLGLYVSGFRPKYLPPELSAQREKIDQLRNLYQICAGAVLEKQQQTDQSNFFISRSTEADQNRCVSLRNKYNYEVDQYNQAIKQIKN